MSIQKRDTPSAIPDVFGGFARPEDVKKFTGDGWTTSTVKKLEQPGEFILAVLLGPGPALELKPDEDGVIDTIPTLAFAHPSEPSLRLNLMIGKAGYADVMRLPDYRGRWVRIQFLGTVKRGQRQMHEYAISRGPKEATARFDEDGLFEGFHTSE